MRHTRNRQLNKISSIMESFFTLPIEVSKKEIWNDKLDSTFKWHRDFEGWGENWVEFDGDEYSYGELIHVRGHRIPYGKGWLKIPRY